MEDGRVKRVRGGRRALESAVTWRRCLLPGTACCASPIRPAFRMRANESAVFQGCSFQVLRRHRPSSDLRSQVGRNLLSQNLRTHNRCGIVHPAPRRPRTPRSILAAPWLDQADEKKHTTWPQRVLRPQRRSGIDHMQRAGSCLRSRPQHDPSANRRAHHRGKITPPSHSEIWNACPRKPAPYVAHLRHPDVNCRAPLYSWKSHQ